MADSILDAHSDAGKSFPFKFQQSDFYGAQAGCPGLVVHPMVSPETQIQVLALIDGTDSSTIGDCIAALPGHPSPVTAVLVLANAGLLEIEDGTLSATSRVFRRSGAKEDVNTGIPNGLGRRKNPLLSNAGMESLRGSMVRAHSFVTRLEGSAFRPGVSILDLTVPLVLTAGVASHSPCIVLAMRDNHLTFGTGIDDRQFGSSLEGYDKLVVVTDRSHTMTADLAAVAQRILGLTLDEMDGYILDSPVPEGASCSAVEYEQLRIFVSEALLLLRRAEVAFTQFSPSHLMAGPKGPYGTLYASGDQIDGSEFVLDSEAFAAEAVQQHGAWIVKQGSEIGRQETSSAGVISQLRLELAYSGVIETQGDKCIVTRPLRFATASDAANFVSGSPDHVWVPIDPV